MARSARDDDAVSRRLQGWSADVLGDEVPVALEEFVGSGCVLGDDDIAIFTTWFHNDRELPGGMTPAERYTARTDIAADERETAERIAAARLGLYRVLEVRAGRSLLLEPLLGGTRVEVMSPHVSREAARWDILLTRVMSGDPLTLFGPAGVFEPCEEVELREELLRLAGGAALEHLDEQSLAQTFKRSALELMRFVPPSRTVEPSFFTLEGDPVAFATAAWKVHDVVAAELRLRSLGRLDPDEPAELDITARRADLVSRRPVLPPGAIVLESSPVEAPDTISLASLRLEDDGLHAEAISVERLEDTIEIVSEDFGDLVELIAHDVQPLEEVRADRRRNRSGNLRSRPPRRGSVQKELGAAFMSERMLRWLDEPHQLLDGQTPREAARGESREEVVRLLRQIENSADRARRDGRPSLDAAPLRAELGLHDELAA